MLTLMASFSTHNERNKVDIVTSPVKVNHRGCEFELLLDCFESLLDTTVFAFFGPPLTLGPSFSPGSRLCPGTS